MSKRRTRTAPPPQYYNLDEDKLNKLNKWSNEILEKLLPQFILYEPECSSFKNCIDNIKKEFDSIFSYIIFGKKDDVYKEHQLKYIKLLRLISTNKIDNCRNKFNFLDKISSINGHGLDNIIFDSMVRTSDHIPHIDRKPPTTNGQRLITDYYKSKPKSSSKSK